MYSSSINIDNNPFDTTSINFNPLILDGAMGSYLQEKGFIPDDVLWMMKINQTNPEAIIQLHEEYINAGANIITTNTFRTNPSALESAGISDYKSYVQQAVKLAHQAAEDKKVLIAGANPPAEDCYQKIRNLSNQKLEINHKKHIDLLIDTDVHFILNETQSHFDEIKIICNYCNLNRLPFIISLYFDHALQILSGEPLERIINFIVDYNPLAIGFNCISSEILKRIWEQVNFSFNWGFYLNCGTGHPSERIIRCSISPDEYLKTVKESLIYNPSFVGSCCGSNPIHTKKIKELIDGKN
ncbi:MAG: homocysteine S-methyltransferase family protein [Ignavibacteriaceae bacterium]